MSWPSFWVVVAAIPTLAIAVALIAVALAWIAQCGRVHAAPLVADRTDRRLIA